MIDFNWLNFGLFSCCTKVAKRFLIQWALCPPLPLPANPPTFSFNQTFPKIYI